MHPISPLLQLPKDLLKKVSHFLSDKEDVTALTLICKKMLELNLYQEWPQLIRERMIRYLNNNPLPISMTPYFDAYKKQSPLSPYDGTVFIHQWLNAVTTLDNEAMRVEYDLEHKICHLIGKEPQSSEHLIHTLLENSEYETAFAYATLRDHRNYQALNPLNLNSNPANEVNYNYSIQNYLYHRKGYFNTLTLTSNLTHGETRSAALVAFIKFGAQKLEKHKYLQAWFQANNRLPMLEDHKFTKIGLQPNNLKAWLQFNNLSELENHEFMQTLLQTNNPPELENHEFIQALLQANNLPVSAIHLLLEKIILQFEKKYPEYDEELFVKFYKSTPDTEELLVKLYKLIPDEYEFTDKYFNPNYHSSHADLEDIYIARLDNKENVMPHFGEEGMTEERIQNFIKHMEALPHPGLKKRIVYSTLEGLYSDDEFSMEDFWAPLYRLEKHFGAQDVLSSGSEPYIDSATETYMIDLLEETPQDFLKTIKKNAELSLAVVELLTVCPDWFERQALGDRLIYSGIETLLLKYGKQDIAKTFSKIHR